MRGPAREFVAGFELEKKGGGHVKGESAVGVSSRSPSKKKIGEGGNG